ncbi:GNAT family N-acetyltransferase [Jannaschia sp. CCS1]|uniref:GNAT family N-acetyltransferase n=1 Tax=Jannaschia sp. (strain CCS1) TaxID=290400 RepID=UPI000053D661|nr:GNAT family N-acetyltransferase [Jannaschia sp. CCS1]ABD55801.1 GCN5-related N-acetyltransferase [Jannaschia sp. CCS1]
MITRALEEGDLPALTALRLEGIRLFPDAFLLTEEEALAAPDDSLSAWINNGTAFGVVSKDRLIGFAGLRGQTFAMSRHRIHMGPFYVTPDAQGSGAADLLLEHLFDFAKSCACTQMELWVAKANTRARAFYARHGFTVVGRIPAAVIQDGTARDDLFMVRDLTVDLPVRGPDGLRRLHAGDWRIFRNIRLEMLRDAPTCFGSTLADWSALAPDEIRDWLTSIHLWAAVEGGVVVATAGWHALGGAVQAHRGHVIAVYTTPRARGSGLSAQLLTRVEEDARAQGISQLELDVGVENAPAIAAYDAAGYNVVGTIPNCLNHDGHIHDQHLMVRTLRA